MLADRVEMEVHAGTELLVMYVRVAVDTQEHCVKQVSYMMHKNILCDMISLFFTFSNAHFL